MELGPARQPERRGAGLEEEGEGVAVGRDAAGEHVDVDVERGGEEGGEVVGLDEGVEGERVWAVGGAGEGGDGGGEVAQLAIGGDELGVEGGGGWRRGLEELGVGLF